MGSAVTEERETTNDDEQEDDSRQQGWTTAERTTFIVSIVIVFALAAIAIAEYINRPAEETAVFEITIEVDQAERLEDSYAIPFSVANAGGAGAREVTVRFEVMPRDGDEVVDELTITIDVLPVRGVDEGLLLISQDPATHTITGRVEAYLLS